MAMIHIHIRITIFSTKLRKRREICRVNLRFAVGMSAQRPGRRPALADVKNAAQPRSARLSARRVAVHLNLLEFQSVEYFHLQICSRPKDATGRATHRGQST